MGATSSKDIHFDIFRQLPGVVQSVVLGYTVGHKPCHFLGLPFGVILSWKRNQKDKTDLSKHITWTMQMLAECERCFPHGFITPFLGHYNLVGGDFTRKVSLNKIGSNDNVLIAWTLNYGVLKSKLYLTQLIHMMAFRL